MGQADPSAGNPDWSADKVKGFPLDGGQLRPEVSWSEPGGQFVAIGAQGRAARAVYDLKTGEKIGQIEHKPGLDPPYALSGDGSQFAASPGGGADRLAVYNVSTGQSATVVKLREKPRRAAFAGASRLVCQFSSAVRAYDTKTGNQVWEAPSPRVANGWGPVDHGAIAISPGGNFVAVAEATSVVLLRVDSGKLAGTLAVVVPPVAEKQPFIVCHGLAFAPSGGRLAAAFRFGPELRVYTWDLSTGRETAYASLPQVRFISNHPEPQFQWSADGDTWLIGDHLIDPRSGKALWRCGGSRPSGRLLLSGLRLVEVLVDPPPTRAWRVDVVALPKERLEASRAAVRAGGVPADAVLPRATAVSPPTPARIPDVGTTPWRVTADPGPPFPGSDNPTPLPFQMSDLTDWHNGKTPVFELRKYDPKEAYNTRSRTVVRVDPQSGRETGRVDLPTQVWLIGASPDGTMAITADADEGRRIDLWSLTARKHVAGWLPSPDSRDDRGRVALASFPTPDRVFTLTAGGQAALWKLPTLKPEYVLDVGPLTDTQLTPGGRYLIGIDDGVVRFVDVLTGKPAGDVTVPGRPWRGSDGRERSDFIGPYLPRLVVRPDGRQLAAIVRDQSSKQFAIRIDLLTGTRSAERVPTTHHAFLPAGYVGSDHVLTTDGVLDLRLGLIVLTTNRVGSVGRHVARAGYRFWYPMASPAGVKSTPAVLASIDLSSALTEVAARTAAPDSQFLHAGTKVAVSVRCEGGGGKSGEESIRRAMDEMLAGRGLVRDDKAGVTIRAVGKEMGPNQVQLTLSFEVGGQEVWAWTQTGPRWESFRWPLGERLPLGVVRFNDKYVPLPLQVRLTSEGAGPVTPPNTTGPIPIPQKR